MCGEMSEWPKEHDWKSCIPLTGYRGFESLSLHQFFPIRVYRLGKLGLVSHTNYGKVVRNDYVLCQVRKEAARIACAVQLSLYFTLYV